MYANELKAGQTALIKGWERQGFVQILDARCFDDQFVIVTYQRVGSDMAQTCPVEHTTPVTVSHGVH